MNFNNDDVIISNGQLYKVIDNNSKRHNLFHFVPAYKLMHLETEKEIIIDKDLVHEHAVLSEKAEYYPWSVNIGDDVKRWDGVVGKIASVDADNAMFNIVWEDDKEETFDHVQACRANDYFNGKWERLECGHWKYKG